MLSKFQDHELTNNPDRADATILDAIRSAERIFEPDIEEDAWELRMSFDDIARVQQAQKWYSNPELILYFDKDGKHFLDATRERAEELAPKIAERANRKIYRLMLSQPELPFDEDHFAYSATSLYIGEWIRTEYEKEYGFGALEGMRLNVELDSYNYDDEDIETNSKLIKRVQPEMLLEHWDSHVKQRQAMGLR